MMEKEWKQYLCRQAELHPSMEPQDVYKLIFQAAFGAEHLLQDKEAAYAYFEKEFADAEAIDSQAEEPLYEQIQANLYRMNLRAWKMRKLPLAWLFHMFVGSVELHARHNDINRHESLSDDTKHRNFDRFVEMAKDAVKEGVFSFSYEQFLQYAEEYEKTGPRAVHHSDSYRVAEKPAYRLVCGEYIRLLPILEAMAELKAKCASDTAKAETILIAIDGRCASGKSTMARMLSKITGAGVVHMDDFYLPMELRTEERLAEPGGNVHYERFREEVLEKLNAGGAFTYRRFDCSKMQLGEIREVAVTSFCITEGAYSGHPIFGDYADMKVFSDVESAEQLRRIGERDGERVLSMFKERWIPMEEKYFVAYRIQEAVDIIV